MGCCVQFSICKRRKSQTQKETGRPIETENSLKRLKDRMKREFLINRADDGHWGWLGNGRLRLNITVLWPNERLYPIAFNPDSPRYRIKSIEFRYSFSIFRFPLKTLASGFNEFCSKKNKFNWKVYLGDDGVVHSATQVVIPSVDGRARLGWPGQIASLCHVYRRFLLYKIATNEKL